MTIFRLGLYAAALSFSSCTLSTAPEPTEFKLSAEALSKQYRATRKTGAVRLYANEIQTTRDEWGRETHVASGGSLLVKESVPPILAMAPRISITPDFAEAHGEATVKKADRLYIGQDESSTIRIDGTAIKPEGPHVVRTIAAVETAPLPTPEPEKLVAAAPAPVLEEAQDSAPPPPREPAKVKPKPVAKPKPEPSAPVVKAMPPVKRSAAVVKVTPPAKPSTVVAKPSSQAPAVKPKVAPAVDRSRLLNLMREPTDR